MKKIMFFAIAMIAMTFIGCKNGDAQDVEAVSDSTSVEVVDTLSQDTVVTDSVSVDTVVAE